MLGYHPIKKRIRCLNLSRFVEINAVNEIVFRIGKNGGYSEDRAEKIKRWIEMHIIQIIVNFKDLPAEIPFLNKMTVILRAYRIPNTSTGLTFTDMYEGKIGDTVLTAGLDYVETGIDTGKYGIYLKIKQVE